MKIFYGPKGTGKTKLIINEANLVNDTAKNCVVFVTDTKRYMYDLNHSIRFIDVKDFDINTKSGLLGFIKGIIAANADLQYIYIDGIARITGESLDNLEDVFGDFDSLNQKYGVEFTVSCSAEKDELPEFIQKYIQ